MTDYSPVYRRCGCTNPVTGRRYGDNCPRLATDPGHGSWYFSVRLGPQRVRRGGFRTAQVAEHARQDLVGQAPQPASDGGLTVAAWLDTWVASLPKRVRPSTANAYTAHVGYLTENPARMLELPPLRRHRPVAWSQPRVAAWLRDGTRPKIAVWTPDQLAIFLTAVVDDDWRLGLRQFPRNGLSSDYAVSDAVGTVCPAGPYGGVCSSRLG
jgi:hypothetical protein